MVPQSRTAGEPAMTLTEACANHPDAQKELDNLLVQIDQLTRIAEQLHEQKWQLCQEVQCHTERISRNYARLKIAVGFLVVAPILIFASILI
jgi:hypothetical protein